MVSRQDADSVERLVLGIEGEQQNGVRSPADHILAGHQEGIVSRFSSALGHVGQLGILKHALVARLGASRRGPGQIGHLRQPNPGAECQIRRNNDNRNYSGRLQQAVANLLPPVQSGHPRPDSGPSIAQAAP